MTIWIFITLASLGAGFLLYASLQFFREPQLTNNAHRPVQGFEPGLQETESRDTLAILVEF